MTIMRVKMDNNDAYSYTIVRNAPWASFAPFRTKPEPSPDSACVDQAPHPVVSGRWDDGKCWRLGADTPGSGRLLCRAVPAARIGHAGRATSLGHSADHCDSASGTGDPHGLCAANEFQTAEHVEL